MRKVSKPQARAVILRVINWLRHKPDCLGNDPMPPRADCTCGLDTVIQDLTGKKPERKPLG